MSTAELTGKIRELKELKQMAEELTEAITTIEDEIKAVMTEKGVEEMSVDVFKIRWQTVTSSRFDSTGLKRAMPDLYSRFTKQTTSRRFSVI